MNTFLIFGALFAGSRGRDLERTGLWHAATAVKLMTLAVLPCFTVAFLCTAVFLSVSYRVLPHFAVSILPRSCVPMVQPPTEMCRETRMKTAPSSVRPRSTKKEKMS
jgi:hypothetical protein